MSQNIYNNGVVEILRSLNVTVGFVVPDGKTFLEHHMGLTIKAQTRNKYWVYIRQGLPEVRAQEVLCHELGHIALGHMTESKFSHMTEEQREKEAEEFAYFIMPYIYEREYKQEQEHDHIFKAAYRG